MTPLGTSSVTSTRAVIGPNRLLTFSTSTIGPIGSSLRAIAREQPTCEQSGQSGRHVGIVDCLEVVMPDHVLAHGVAEDAAEEGLRRQPGVDRPDPPGGDLALEVGG